MLKFEFNTISKRDGREGRLGIHIHPPRRLDAFPHDYECEIVISGVVEKELRAVGVVPFQALDLAIQVTKAVVTSYGGDWELFHEGAGPITLNY